MQDVHPLRLSRSPLPLGTWSLILRELAPGRATLAVLRAINRSFRALLAHPTVVRLLPLSDPALPNELWLAILGACDYGALKKAGRLSQSFRALVHEPAFAASRFNEALSPAKIALAVASDKVKGKEGTSVRLHPLLADVGWFVRGPDGSLVVVVVADCAQALAAASSRQADGTAPHVRLVSAVDALGEKATSPAVGSIVLQLFASAFGFLTVVDPDGVTVGEALRECFTLAQTAHVNNQLTFVSGVLDRATRGVAALNSGTRPRLTADDVAVWSAKAGPVERGPEGA